VTLRAQDEMSYGAVMRTALLLLVASFGLVACSSDDTTTSSSSQSFKCCVNGVYYDCKTQDDMKTCGTSTMKCPADPSKNDQCK
jgi:hypothetical protein